MEAIQQEMEVDSRKVFIGGISWDTMEDHLLKYFKKYGEVEEVIIMRDRVTGCSRGFGFIVFADPAVANHVIMKKHIIDGRMVEAKKAIPRDDMYALNKSHGSAHGSRGHNQTKKIFIGGLASNVTKVNLTKYFKQFGKIIDAIVVYDRKTQRPRGFGFITFVSEAAMDRALFKTFHKLKGKMVEVKRAIPKEQSPGHTMCSPINRFNYVTGRSNNFLSGYTQHYDMSPLGGYGMRMDECFGLLSGRHNGYPSFGGSYGIGMNLNPWVNPCIESAPSFNSTIQHGWHLNPYYNGNSGGLNNYVSYGGVNDNNGLVFDSLFHNLWGIFGLNHSSTSTSSNFFVPFGNGDLSGTGNNNVNWGNPHHVPTLGANNYSIYCTRNVGYGSSETHFGYRSNESNFGQGSSVYGRNDGSSDVDTFSQSTNGYARNFGDSSAGGGSNYGDTTWRSGSFEHDGTNPLGSELQNYFADITTKSSTSYMGH